MWIMWISSLLLAGGLVIIQLLELQNGHYLKLALIVLIPLGIGCGGFQANVIQFGVDQFVHRRRNHGGSGSYVPPYVFE
jgi:uncharacterized membrane protein